MNIFDAILSLPEFIVSGSIGLALLGAVLSGLLVVAMLTAFSRRKVIVEDGERQLAPSDLERLAAPIAKLFLRKRDRRDVLAKQLQWAHFRFTPEVWVALPWFLAPLGGVLAFLVGAFIGVSTMNHVLITGFGIMGGLVYPGSKLSGKLRARQRGISADVPAFISYYARVFSVQRDMGRTFQEMDRRVREHKRFFDLRGGTMSAEVRRQIARSKGKGPYDSALWTELETLAAQVPHGIVDAMATVENPDPLSQFAMECNDADLTTFVSWLRESQLQGNPVEPEHLDNQVEMIRAKRIEDQRKSFAKLTNKATAYAVMGNLPLIFIAIMAPVLIPLLVQG